MGAQVSRLKRGQMIRPPAGTEFTVVEVDNENDRVLLQFEHMGQRCRVWTSRSMIRDKFETKPRTN